MKSLSIVLVLILFAVVVPVYGIDTSLSTGFAGTKKANGNIFTITAKENAVSITSFDINMDGASTPQPAPVEIYLYPGVAPGFASVNYPYTKIFQNNITGKGKGNVTELPDLTSPVVIPAGSTYSFYVTVASLTFGTNIWYNDGVAVGDIYASDQYIEIGEGYALGYPFIGYTANRRWNGNVHYTILSPTPSPTTRNPTIHPTLAPTKTSQPTTKPTTPNPTSLPTNLPSTFLPTTTTHEPTSFLPTTTSPTSLIPTNRVPTESPTTIGTTTSKPSTFRPTVSPETTEPTKGGPPVTSLPTTSRPSSSSTKSSINLRHSAVMLFATIIMVQYFGI